MKNGTISFFNDLLIHFLSAVFPISARGGIVLMYHSVGRNAKFSTVTPVDFELQMAYLREARLSVVSLREMLRMIAGGESVSGCVAVTFDDGYKDNLTNAFPALKKFQVPATIFVATDRIGNEMMTRQGEALPMLSVDDLRVLAAEPTIDIMPHTMSHRKLSALPIADAVTEIEGSRKCVEDITGKTADVFAYPYGDHTQDIVSYLRGKRTWKGAVTVTPGLVKTGDDPFTLPRIMVDSTTTMSRFRMSVSGALGAYLCIKKWVRWGI